MSDFLEGMRKIEEAFNKEHSKFLVKAEELNRVRQKDYEIKNLIENCLKRGEDCKACLEKINDILKPWTVQG